MLRFYALWVTISFSLLFFPSVAPSKTMQVVQAEQNIPANSEKQDSQESKPNIFPDRVLIPGVPFISWREAAKLKLATNDPVNPSLIATISMVLEFWGKDRKLLKQADFESELKSSGFQIMSHKTSGKAWTITDLKTSLARGVPVAVALPLSPVAHPLALTSEIGISLGQIKGVELKDQGRPRSNALGRMVSLEDLKKIKEQMRMNPMTEDYLIADRLVIGYDDHTKFFIVHDPSFGPAFEIGYNDFDKMWEAADRNYYVVSPKGFSPGMPEKRLAGAYRERTPDQRAAEHFVYGYALDCLGQLYEGAEHFEKGLSIPGISKGYQFLLQFELALNLGERGDFAHAIEAAEKAKALVPEAPSSWEFLSLAYLTIPESGNREKATENGKKAQALMKDQRALKSAATTLPADFLIQYLQQIRGWGGN